MAYFSDKTTYKELEIMAAQSPVMNCAKDSLIKFADDPANLAAYDEAEEAERIRADRESFVIDETKREMVQKMKKENLDISLIQRISGWTEEQILACPV